MDFLEEKPLPKLDIKLAKGQAMMVTDNAAVFVDNGRGSYKYFRINDADRGVYQPVNIELNEINGEVEINMIRLSTDQRQMLIKFLTQIK